MSFEPYFAEIGGRQRLIDRPLDEASPASPLKPGAYVKAPECLRERAGPNYAGRWLHGTLLGYTRPRGYAYIDLGADHWLAHPEDIREVGTAGVLQPSGCGVPGHTEADIERRPHIAGVADTFWCGACEKARPAEGGKA